MHSSVYSWRERCIAAVFLGTIATITLLGFVWTAVLPFIAVLYLFGFLE